MWFPVLVKSSFDAREKDEELTQNLLISTYLKVCQGVDSHGSFNLDIF